MRILTVEQQALAADNIKLAYYFANKFWAQYRAEFENLKITRDDVCSEAMIGMCEAIAAYSPAKGKLATIVGVNIRHKCLTLLIRGARATRVANSCRYSQSLDAPVGAQQGRLTLGDVIADRRDHFAAADMATELTAGIDALPLWQRDILRGIMGGRRQVDLAKQYGRSQRWVSTELKTARAKLRRYLEDAI